MTAARIPRDGILRMPLGMTASLTSSASHILCWRLKQIRFQITPQEWASKQTSDFMKIRQSVLSMMIVWSKLIYLPLA